MSGSGAGRPMAVGARYSVHFMRPACTHGSAHRGDLVARPFQAAPRQLARHAGPKWRRLPQGAVRAMHVVVIGVLGQYSLQLPASQGQYPIQDLTPNRADPPLRVRICPRRPHRRAQHLESLGTKDRVERDGELRVLIAIRNRNRPTRSSRPMSRLRACCVTHSPNGCGVTPSTWTRRVPTSIANNTYSRFSDMVSTVKKSTASTPLACARRNCRHETAARCVAGSGGASV